ncbi:MAG: adenine nucleotide alpha hydrolase, partial [Acidobacteria bacterium]|nr:adenine nucleotide alpha hydrolase [Acidobacteriota bacterium]
VLRRASNLEVVGLLTTLNETFDRVAMHAVRRVLLEAQAEAAGLPLQVIPIPWPCSNEQYENIMAGVCSQAREAGIEAVAFGDLFLRDIRQYREKQLRGTGLEPLFPLWDLPTPALAREMIASGLRAKLTCVDPKRLSSGFAGRDFDQQLLDDLPANVDPCGENGEFHSFVYSGPIFDRELRIRVGDIVERDGFVFADVLPSVSMSPPGVRTD